MLQLNCKIININIKKMFFRDPTAKILIIGDEPRLPYMRPPLSKVCSILTNKDTVHRFRC